MFANVVFMKRDAIVVAVGSLLVNGVEIGIEGVESANYLGKQIWLSFLIQILLFYVISYLLALIT